MTTWFTSDLHIGHKFVAGLRGFWDGKEETKDDGVEAHNQFIAGAFDMVKPDDVVWILGDICITERTWRVALELLSKLPGRKRLVSGNHDPVASFHSKAWKHKEAAYEVFESVQDYATATIAGETALLSHYPYSGVGSEGLRGPNGEQHEERYTEFRLTDRGRVLIHGHTHGPEKFHLSQSGTPQVHVGLDAWNMRLVSQYEIERLLAKELSLLHPRQS